MKKLLVFGAGKIADELAKDVTDGKHATPEAVMQAFMQKMMQAMMGGGG